MNGYSLICFDKIRKVYLYQKGREFIVKHEGDFGKVEHNIKGETALKGLDEAEKIYQKIIKGE